MPICSCGCEAETKGGDFCQGHDQKFRARIEALVGGLLNLKAIAELAHDHINGRISLESFGQGVRSIIPQE